MSYTAEDRDRTAQHRRDILAALKEGPKFNHELFEYTWGFSATIHQLREQGHEIESKHITGPTWKFVYRGQEEVVRATKTIQMAYCQTAHWKAKRRERIEFDGHRCCQCKTTEFLEVHHWEYELFEEDLQHLMTLCKTCHEHLHYNPHGRMSFPRSIHLKYRDRLNVKQDESKAPCDHSGQKLMYERRPDGRHKVSCICGKFMGIMQPSQAPTLF